MDERQRFHRVVLTLVIIVFSLIVIVFINLWSNHTTKYRKREQK